MTISRLVLNNSLNKGELGDLIILIGANNSGKSNVLDALNIFGNGKISERDVTDLYMEDECRKPKLTLFCRKGKSKEDDYAYIKTFAENDTCLYPEIDKDEYESIYSSKENFLNDLTELVNIERNHLGQNRLGKILGSIKMTDNTVDDLIFENYIMKVFTTLKSYEKDYGNRYNWQNFVSYSQNGNLFKEYVNYYRNQNKDYKKELKKSFYEKYNYDFFPNFIIYKDTCISNKDLNTNYKGIDKNKFFISLFNSINFELSSIENAYETFSKQINKGVLTQLETKINKKLKAVADKFNKLYYLENTSYSFKVSLESENIFFSLFRGEQTIFLDYQSTGFKWFFNLFFNLLNSTDLNPGDVIIMDEPATNLHVKGQKELRGFLKDFAIHSDVTIVIATHSPFLIDLDYLDEIRVIVNKDNISTIENSFAAVNENDPDSLLAIKDSLTVENHILVNPKETVVFVEGITDYNYLTAFKKLFGKEGITFLPINGVGKTKEECKKTTEKLMRIRKDNPILLVDSDKAGEWMKEINDGNKDITIISLSEADANFKTIESLFSQDDLKKFGLTDDTGKSVKHSSTSTVFKNHILKNKDEISDATKKNFEKLFKKLQEETE